MWVMGLYKHDLVRIFNETGLLLELKGENPFKARAYYTAARTIENMTGDLAELAQKGELHSISGFGEAIVAKIQEWLETGTIAYYENLRNVTPPGLLEMLRVPGLGPKKIQVVFQKLGVSTIEELEGACRENRLAALPGFGAKTQEKICAGIEFIKQNRGSFLWMEGFGAAERLRRQMAQCPDVLRIEIAGSLRRYKEIVHDIDLLAASHNPQNVGAYFRNLLEIAEVTSNGDTKISVLLHSGMAADLRIVKPEEFPHALQHFTGSKEHNTALRHSAKRLGYKVNEYGLFQNENAVYCGDEAEIYRRLGFGFIPPELREDMGELNAAETGILPVLIGPQDIVGLLHIHTAYSDGANTLEEMVQAARERDYTYLGISDHSQVAVYAHGLTKDKLKLQFAEIDAVNQKYPDFKVFKGIEADILPSGELDYDAETLGGFDFVIGSIHSQFRMSREAMTDRVLKAMDNPALTILGHPTGRILLERSGYDIDLDAVVEKAAEKGVILEFNASPYRLDLDWRWIRKAKERGVLISINPDAHSIAELDLARAGLMFARKGWLEAKDVLNTRSRSEVETFLACRRR